MILQNTKLFRLLDAPWIDRNALDHTFDREHTSAPRRLRTHLILACLAFIALLGPTSAMQIAIGVIAAYTLLRLPRTWRHCLFLLRQPIPILILLWFAYHSLSLLWSPDPAQGFRELASLRTLIILFFIYTVIESRSILIAALVAAFLVGNLAQLSEIALPDFRWYGWNNAPNRDPGWWGAARSGVLLTAALGLHLPAALLGSGKTRIIAIALTIITILALLATGARAGWLASIALILIVTLFGLRKHPKRLLLTLAIATLIAATAGFFFRDKIATRYETARTEISDALQGQNLRTATGARIAMNIWGLRAFAANPLTGVGSGGYKAWVTAEIQRQNLDPKKYSVLYSAHSAPIQIAAEGGIIAIALILLLLIAIARAITHATPNWNSYAAGPACALLGLLLASPFDSLHLATRPLALIFILLALCPAVLPARVRS